MSLEEIVVPPDLENAAPDPEKLEAARRRLRNGTPLLPIHVARIGDRYVLQLGHATYHALKEAGRTDFVVMLTNAVRFDLRGKKVDPASGTPYGGTERQVVCPACGGRLLARILVLDEKNRAVCPDCRDGSAITDRSRPAADWGFPATEEAVAQFVKAAGVSPEEAKEQIRLATAAGCLFQHQDGGQKRTYSKNRMRFVVENGRVVAVNVAPSFRPPFPSVAELTIACEDMRRKGRRALGLPHSKQP